MENQLLLILNYKDLITTVLPIYLESFRGGGQDNFVRIKRRSFHQECDVRHLRVVDIIRSWAWKYAIMY